VDFLAEELVDWPVGFPAFLGAVVCGVAGRAAFCWGGVADYAGLWRHVGDGG